MTRTSIFLNLEKKVIDTTIQGIKFTSREIDIMACIVSGRGRKTIASLLSISDKTVETHTHNIMRKLELHSQESIREVIERSSAFSALKKHYVYLLKDNSFNKKLKKLSLLVNQEENIWIVHEEEGVGVEESFLKFFITSLEAVGFKISFILTNSSLLKKIEKEKKSGKKIFILYFSSYFPLSSNFQDKESLFHNIVKLHESLAKERFPLVCIIPDLLDKAKILQDKKINFLKIGSTLDRYDLFFKLLKELSSYPAVIELEEEFKNECNYFHEEKIILSKKEAPLLPKFKKNYSLFQSLEARKKYGLIAAIEAGFIFISLYLKNLFPENNISTAREKKYLSTIRSDLTLPTSGVFLNRIDLLKEINDKFTDNNDIQAIALVGMGGAGKTTLAHHYARQQTNTFIWEINAASSENLRESFENLAHACSLTKEDQQNLAQLLEIKDPIKKEEKIMGFIKKRMRTYPQWFLLFDNVEKFSEIQKYLPKDSQTWGRGKILITTRDRNIQNNKHINEVVYIGILNDQQKFDLFSKIMETSSDGKSFSLEDPSTKKFLEQIPPFPLDITVAAYYLKATSASYDTYIESLKQYDQDFIKVQESLLREAGEYDKTRYSIIILSLNHLLKASRDFKDLLLLISLLDSQDIPRDLLSVCKNESIAGNFLYNLEKYSLVTINSFASDISPTLSLHRSLQQIILDYLTKSLRLNESPLFIQGIADIIENYIQKAISKENLAHVKLFVRHLGAFLSHDHLLTLPVKGVLESALGRLYFYIGDYKQAAKLLSKNLLIVRKYYKERSIKVAQILDTLGVIYKELENYSKAKEVIEESLVLYQTYYPNNYKDIFHSLVHLANIYRDLGQLQEAKELFEKSIFVYKKYVPQDKKEIIWALVHLGISYRGLEQYKNAIAVFEECLNLYNKHFPNNNVRRAWVLANLGNAHRLGGNPSKALILLKESIQLYHKESLEHTINGACTLCYLGETYQDLKNYEEATKNFKKSLFIYQACYGKDHLKIAQLLRNLGRVTLTQNNLTEAAAYIQDAAAMYQRGKYPDKEKVLKEWENFLKSYQSRF